jgi:predicted branched-subunit amino acid permease
MSTTAATMGTTGVTTTVSTPATAREARRELRRGVLTMAPVLAGLAPIGLLVGTTIAAQHAEGPALAATWLVYGASAHLALMELTGAGVSGTVVVATCLLINARLLLYSASLSTHWKGESTLFKVVLAPTIVDPSFALGDARYQQPGSPEAKRSFYVGAAATLWFGWSALVTLGIVAGARLGELRVLELALPLCLVAMFAPRLVQRPGRAAVAVAAAVAYLGRGWPSGVGLLAAIVLGATAGAVVEGRTR